MKTRSIAEIKKELHHIDKADLIAHCLRIAKYKTDNKGLLSYLLFNQQNLQDTLAEMKEQISYDFSEVPPLDKHYSKKSIRKVLRTTLKFAKYIQQPELEIELLLHFCKEYKRRGLSFSHQPIILNIYFAQIKKIEKLISNLHEDLQYDYNKEVEVLMLL
jgi:hypothetical protein